MRRVKDFENACIEAADKAGKLHTIAGSPGILNPFDFRAQRLFEDISKINRDYELKHEEKRSGILKAVNHLRKYFLMEELQ